MQDSRFDNQPLFSTQHLPHNFLAERIILSCLLINNEAIEITIKTLPVKAFYFKNHQEIYKTIRLLYETNNSIDILTITTFLQDNGQLEKIGGVKVLIELLSQIPNLIYFEEYLNLVKDKFLRRSLIKLSYESINSAYITSFPLEETLNKFEKELFKLTNESSTKNLFSSTELVNNIFFDLKQKSLNSELLGLMSGFKELDLLTQGFQKSDLIVLAGRPSIGKTALALNIGINIIQNYKLPVLFFSLEMSKEQITQRLLSMEANITQAQLRNGTLEQSDWLTLKKVIKVFSKLPFFIDDTIDLSVNAIRSKIRTIIFEQGKIGLVIIDYLQLMQVSKLRIDNRVQELSVITRLLKTMAREFNTPILTLSQLSRNVENRVDKRPILSDLRESGSIEQDSDLVLLLYRNQFNNIDKLKTINEQTFEPIELILAKQRNGPTGTAKLYFDKKRTKFFDF